MLASIRTCSGAAEVVRSEPVDGDGRRAVRLGYLVSHPIQYQAPLLRAVAARPEVDLEVLFLSSFSAGSYHDPEFGVSVAWDVPLLDGYSHRFLSSAMPTRLGPWVPGLERSIDGLRLDALWVHGHSHPTTLRAIRHARRRGVKLLLRGESSASDPRGWLRAAVLRRVMSAVDACLPIGERNRRFYLEHGVPEDRLFDVPYAVDNEFFARVDLAEVAALRSRLELPTGRPVVLFAAKLIARKRPGDLLRAFLSARRVVPGVDPVLLFVGDGELRSDLLAQTARLDPGVVRFLGFQNQRELPALYALADVFVLPSSHETYGLSVNEAMAAGVPVIASDQVGAADDLIVDGESGFVVRVGDTEALADRLAVLLRDPDRRRRMGAAGRQRVEARGVGAACAGLMRAVERVVPR